MSALAFVSTSFGIGSVVRFKMRKSHRWEYGIYRGTAKREDGSSYAYELSDTPLGPITRWLMYWPEYMEAAVVAPVSPTDAEEGIA